MPPNAKTVMHQAHLFDGADIIVRSHSMRTTARPRAGFGSCCLNTVGAKYTFAGAPASSGSPWNGRNALEAVIRFFENADSVRPSIRPRRGFRYLQQVVEFVDNAAKAAALSTGTKVKIEHDGKELDGISVSTLNELAFAYMKKFGATSVQPAPGKPEGFEETGSVSRDIPGASIAAQSSTAPNHTYQMDADNLTGVGHAGFTIDAQTMTAILFDFATHADYRVPGAHRARSEAICIEPPESFAWVVYYIVYGPDDHLSARRGREESPPGGQGGRQIGQPLDRRAARRETG